MHQFLTEKVSGGSTLVAGVGAGGMPGRDTRLDLSDGSIGLEKPFFTWSPRELCYVSLWKLIL